MNRMLRVLSAVALFGLAGSLGLPGGSTPAHAAVVDRIAAVVDNEVITLSEIYELGGDYIQQAADAVGATTQQRRELELEVLDTLILRRLVSQEMVRLGMDVTNEELDASITDIASRNGMELSTLRGEVESQGMEWEGYREEIQENLRQSKFNSYVIQPRITVNEDELADAYRRMFASMNQPRIVDLGAIFFRVPPGADEVGLAAVVAKAEAAQQRLAGGAEFSVVAAALDEGGFGSNGGRMGTYEEGQLQAEMEAVAFALESGEISEPVITPRGVFLFKVFETRRKEPPAIDSVRDQLLDQVYSGRIEEETDQWYRQARRRSAVEVKLEIPGA
jgi:peptidyl-prolyl cis-trans isomerase SurA